MAYFTIFSYNNRKEKHSLKISPSNVGEEKSTEKEGRCGTNRQPPSQENSP